MAGVLQVGKYNVLSEVTTDLLEDGVLSADIPGRAKMASGFFSRDTLDKFAKATFLANSVGRSKFAPGFIDENLIEAGAVTPAKLKYQGQNWDFSTAASLRAKTPVNDNDVVIKSYADAIGTENRVNYAVVDPVADAVPGQPNTYYINKGSTTYGYNVGLDNQGIPDLMVIINGRFRLWVTAANLTSLTIPGDFTVVRSLSTGIEGNSAVGSLNAIKLAAPLNGTMWVHYKRKSLATA